MIKIDIKDFTLVREGMEDVPCTVPCSLYRIMRDRGELTDLYKKDNIRHTEVGASPVSFVARIRLDEATKTMRHVYLTFTRIFADAEVYLNGKCYRRVHNYNRIYTVEVSDSIQAGENLLEIRCTRPLPERKVLDTGMGGYMEYDLCPYLPDVGIIGDCSLIATNNAMIDKIAVKQRHEDDRVTLEVALDTIGECADMRAVITLTSPAGRMFFGSIVDGVGTVTVTNPELWWPRGLGSPTLYKLTVSLYCNGSLDDMRSIMIGLRHIELVTGEDGKYMTVNGARFYPMGATYVREDPIIPDITRERLTRLISSAADANMNTLRLIGNGLYPDDSFYDICDEYGIMVWQDVSLYYVKPPVAQTFAAGVYNELCDILSRISHHACVALAYLCITERAGGDTPANSASLREFADVCYHIAEPLASRFVCDVPFVQARESLEESDESSLYEGNILKDTCFVSLPPRASVLEFADGEDLNILSPVMETHTAGRDAVAKMLVNMASCVRYPYDFDSLIYATQLTAGYSVYRSVSRARLDGSGTSFAVCRQLNDSWPSVCASSVDFFGRRKALHYYSKRAFSPIFVASEMKDGKVTLGVSNETQKPLDATLTYALYSIDGVCHFEASLDASVPPHGKSANIEEDFSARIDGRPSDFYLVLTLHGKGRRLFRSVLLFERPKHVSLSRPIVCADITGEGTSYEMLLRADTLALGTEVSFDGIDADFSDNYVTLSQDLYEKITVTTSKPTTAEELNEKLVIRTVYDIGR